MATPDDLTLAAPLNLPPKLRVDRGAIVVLLDHVRSRTLADRVRARFPNAQVHVIAERSTSEQVDALLELPAPQVVIDVGDATRAVERFRALFLALAPGGVWIAGSIEQPQPGVVDVLEEAAGGLGGPAGRRRRREARRAGPDASRADRQRLRHESGLGRAIGRVGRRDDILVVRKVGAHARKLNERNADRVLEARLGVGRSRILQTLPPTSFRSRAKSSTNNRIRRERLDRVFEVPALFLREHHDAICTPYQLAALDDLVLPGSYHHPAIHNPMTRALTKDHPRFGRVKDAREPVHLAGVYFHLDSEFPAHYGHLLTEDISKLWGWDEAKARHPDLKVLRATGDHDAFAPWELAILGGYGIAESDVVRLQHPARVDVLVTASQMFHNGAIRYAHPDLANVWSRIRDGARSARPSGAEHIFVTRSDVKRACLNRVEVEAVFESHGFVVVKPEMMPIAEQIELFAGASVVAGLAGSGMFNTFVSPPGTRIVIGSEEYPAVNEYLIAAVIGGQYHEFMGPVGPYDPNAERRDALFHRNFFFDFERDGSALERVLGDL